MGAALHLEDAPAPATEADDHLVHLVCFCTPMLALCGKQVSGREWLPMIAYPDDCMVCDDLSGLPCGTCDRGRDVSDGGQDA